MLVQHSHPGATPIPATTGASGTVLPDHIQLVLFTGERMASGIPIPSSVIELYYDSEDFTWSDTLQTTFTATSPEMYVMIVAGKAGDSPVHLYIDDYSLRRNWISTLNCDPNNPNNTYAQERRYRYGFNGMEYENPINTGAYDFGARIYDSRLGRRWNVDPITYPWHSPYLGFNNNPLYFVDPFGLFGSKSDAKEHAKKNDISTGIFSKNKIVKNKDGSWSIDNKKENSSIYVDEDFGLITATLVEGNLSSISSTKSDQSQGLNSENLQGIRHASNVLLGSAGTVLNGFEIIIENEVKGLNAKNTKTSAKKGALLSLDNKKLASFTKKLGYAGALVNASTIGYDYAHNGNDITASQIFDLTVTVALAALTCSNPIFIAGFAIYGLADSAGVFDELKESLGGDTVIFKGREAKK